MAAIPPVLARQHERVNDASSLLHHHACQHDPGYGLGLA